MSNLQIKAISHIQKLLKGYQTHSTYSAMLQAMIKEGIDNDKRDVIMKAFQSEIHKQTKLVSEAKAWAKSMLEDHKE